ncbi:hypothetical protein HDV05_005546 [Chytridiales sp. JEL 0842]|nr:hypothetical protein HDV05_005546 [Chytridiales sp. JEL 0842]
MTIATATTLPVAAAGHGLKGASAPSSLILSWAIQGKNVLVVGSDSTAASRALFALEAHANVTLACPASSITDAALKNAIEQNLVKHHNVHLAAFSNHLDALLNPSLALAIICLDSNPTLARELGLKCKERCIPVNVSTASDLSDFFFLSTYRDQSLQVAVSTNGNGPRLASKVRLQIALALAEGTGAALENLGKLRALLRTLETTTGSAPSSASARTAFLNTLSESWPISTLASLDEKDLQALSSSFLANPHSATPPPGLKRGTLHLLHSPLTADDLTRKSMRALLESVLVVADFDVPRDILEYAGGEICFLPSKTQQQGVVARERALRRVRSVLESGGAVVRAFEAGVVEEEEWIAELMREGWAVEGLGAAPVVVEKAHHHHHQVSPAPVVPHAEDHHHQLPVAAEPAATVVAKKKKSHVVVPTTQPFHPVTASQTLAKLTSTLTPLSFIYPPTPNSAPFKPLLDLQSSSTSHVSKALETRQGAGDILRGATSAGERVSAVIHSRNLKHLGPALHTLIHSPSSTEGVVVHVPAEQTDAETLKTAPGFAEVFETSYTGFNVFVSSSVGEVNKVGTLAHVVSRVRGTGVLHAFDASLLNKTESNVGIPEKSEELKAHVDAAVESLKKSAIPLCVPELFKNAALELYGASDPISQPFEYIGHPQASTVLVSLGASCAVLEQAIRTALKTDSNRRVGLVKIRVLRPWSPSHLLAVLPTTVSTVAVLDLSKKQGETHGLLHLDVTSAFYDAAWTQAVPTILNGGVKGELSLQSVLQFLESASNKNKDGFHFELEHAAVVADSTVVVQEDALNATQLGFFDVVSDAISAVVPDRLGSFLGHVQGVSYLHSQISRDTVRLEPLQSTTVTFGNNLADVESLSASKSCMDLAVVSNVKLLELVNVVRNLKARGHGTLVLNVSKPFTESQLSRVLPLEVRNSIAERQVRVVLVDAKRVVDDFTLFRGVKDEYLALVMEAVAVKVLSEEKGVKVSLDAWRKHAERRLAGVETDHTVYRTKLGAIDTALKSLVPWEVPVEVWGGIVEDGEEGWVKLPWAVETSVDVEGVCVSDPDDEDQEPKGAVLKHAAGAALPVMFKEAYGVHEALRPDLEEQTFTVRVTENRRLTPESYDRNVFHLEMDTAGTGLKYDIGEALGVHGENDPVEVKEFIDFYGLNAQQVVAYSHPTKKAVEYRTIEQLFVQVVDLFGKPGKKFYQQLVHFASDMKERERLGWLTSSEPGAEDEFKRLSEEETVTFVDLLRMFPSAKPSVEDLLVLIPPIKPRHYSISSSMNVHPTSVHLLVVVVDWETPTKRKRHGQCTRFLVNLQPGQTLTVSVKPSVMKLPPSHEAPVIMSGLGTGMAPFRAFVEERAYQKSLGKKVGPMVLYFGARHRSEEYLYGEELEAYHADGVLTYLRLAFSRDQKEKVYIQHKIAADSGMLGEMMLREGGAFYLCGPTWPVPDVKDALVTAFVNGGGMTVEQANERLEELKEEERYVLEVY